MRSSTTFVVACALLACALFSVSPVPVAATGPVLKCLPAYAPSILSCKGGSSRPVSGSGNCCACPSGSYSALGTACLPCSSTTAAVSGVDVSRSGSQCFCIAGYGDYNSATGTCRRCPENTYSSNNQCLPCATGTFSAAQSTSCAAVKCPVNSYLPPGGSVLANCVSCNFGTAGQACSTVQACKCMSGFANFNATTGNCQQCTTLNSIAVYANMNAIELDDTATVCTTCPLGTIASADKRTCNPAPVKNGANSASTPTAVTSFPTTPIPGLACPCLNGYDITAGYINKLDSSKSRTISTSHSEDPTFPVHISAVTPESVFASSPPTLGFILIADADTTLVRGVLIIAATQLAPYGSNFSPFLPFLIGLTCDQVVEKYKLDLQTYPCISMKTGTSLATIQPQLKAYGFDFMAPTWDLQYQFQCASDLTLFTCSSPSVAKLQLAETESGGAVINLAAPQTASFSTFLGDGTSKFGQKVVAFYDKSGIVLYVLAAPPASSGNTYLSSDATQFPIVGKKCVMSGTVAACIKMTNQFIPMTRVMNVIAPGAFTNDVYAIATCQ